MAHGLTYHFSHAYDYNYEVVFQGRSEMCGVSGGIKLQLASIKIRSLEANERDMGFSKNKKNPSKQYKYLSFKMNLSSNTVRFAN